LVVCALPVDPKKKKANAEKLHKKRPAITRLSEFVCWGLITSHAKPLCKANPDSCRELGGSQTLVNYPSP
jgi:hypothetical protein